jgi:phosphohistidine phosphatase
MSMSDDEQPLEATASANAPIDTDATEAAPGASGSLDADGSMTEPGADAASSEPDQPLSLAVYFLRHGDAGDPAAWSGDDSDRPLSKKGRRQAMSLAQHFKELDVRPGVLLTSPKVRSAETARIVGKAIGVKAKKHDPLGLDFGSEALISLVAGLKPDVRSIMLVGHDPDFSAGVSWLVGAPISLRKGALAVIDLPDRTVAAGRGSLRWLLPPDAVRG